MAETAQTNGNATAPENLSEIFGVEKITVTRNEQAWDYVPAKLRKRSQTDADSYGLVPQKPTVWDDATKAAWIKHVGIEALIPISFTRVRAIAANVTESSVIETGERAGEFSEQSFTSAMENPKFSLRGETMTELNDEMDELSGEMITLAKDKTVSPADRMTRFTEIAQRMGEIKEALEVKARESKPRGPRKNKVTETKTAPAAPAAPVTA